MISITKTSRCLVSVILLILCCVVYAIVLTCTHRSLPVSLAALIVTFILLYSLNKFAQQIEKIVIGYKKSKINRSRMLKLLASVMGIFISTGSLLYMMAYYRTTDNGFGGFYSFGEYLLRSITSSIDLFLLDIDSNVMDDIKTSPYLKSCIAIQAILSASCTIALIVSLIFARARAYYDIHYRTKITSKINHLYVFFGINEPSILLAKDINKRDGDHALIILVEQIQINEEDTNGWDNIVGIFSHRETTFKIANDVGAKVILADSKLHDVSVESLTPQGEDKYEILDELNISQIKKLVLQLKRYDNSELHVFMLSDNEDENIRDLAMLTKDYTIVSLADSSVSQRYYCHARRKGINRVIEDIAFKNKGLDVRIIDSSLLSVELLKQKRNCQPVNLVKLSKTNPTTVDSEFNSLIIGFDEVGQDTFRYLYEFAAFVDSKSTDTNVRRSPYNCVVIDKEMQSIKGAFEAFTPVLKAQKSYNPHIELVAMDYKQESFFEKYCSRPLNYVVIAAGDEEAGMSLAVQILNYQRIQNNDIEKLRIMVRCYTQEKEELLQKIADHYNKGIVKGKDLGIINLFGQPEQIYTYDMIINDILVEQGKKFLECYSKLKGESTNWESRRIKLVNGTIDDLRKLRRQESQDLANATHAKTKLILLKQAMPSDFDWEFFIHRYFTSDTKPDVTGHFDEIRYVGLDDYENVVVKRLAMLEHLRWNASHEMLGYIAPESDAHIHSCNEKTRVHNCLIDWEDLDDESKEVTQKEGWDCDYKLFDYGTVDTSIYLHRKELMRKAN